MTTRIRTIRLKATPEGHATRNHVIVVENGQPVPATFLSIGDGAFRRFL